MLFWLTVSTSKLSSSLMLKRLPPTRWGLSHMPRSSSQYSHITNSLSSSDISYVHSWNIKNRSKKKCPMFCRNIIEFPIWQITSTRYALHCSTSHAKIHDFFGMTFAKDRTYRAPEICRNGNESTFRQNIGHSEVHCKQEHQDILYIQNASSSTFTTHYHLATLT